jgi:biotin operon repressor
MEKGKRPDKSYAKKKLLNSIKDEYKSAKKIRKETGLSSSTIYSIINRLKKNETISEIRAIDPNGYSFSTYRYLSKEDTDEFEWLMNAYNTATYNKDYNKIKMLQKDIENTCIYKDLQYKPFVEFIVEQAQRTDIENRPLRRCLGHIEFNLQKSIETRKKPLTDIEGEIHNKIYSSVNFLTKIIFDKKRDYIERIEAFDILKKLDHQKKFEVAFELLKIADMKEKKFNDRELNKYFKVEFENEEMISEYEIFAVIIRELILLYAKRNLKDCRKKLYDLMTSTTNEKINDEVRDLLKAIRYESEDMKIFDEK